MASLPDHIFAPPLRRWLPVLLADARVAVWPGGLGRAPRSITRILSAWPGVADVPDPTALLIFAELCKPGVDVTAAALDDAGIRPARIVEISVPVRRGIRAALTPWRSRSLAAEAAADRMAQWLVAGLRDAEQWVSVDPDDAVVTTGRWSARPMQSP